MCSFFFHLCLPFSVSPKPYLSLYCPVSVGLILFSQICPPPVSSVEVALLIGISICGICSPMLACSPSLFPPPPFPAQYVCVWPDAAWQVLRPTSIFHTLTAHINRHTQTQNCTDTHTTTFQKCLCMACAGVEGQNGRERNKNNFSSLFLPV